MTSNNRTMHARSEVCPLIPQKERLPCMRKNLKFSWQVKQLKEFLSGPKFFYSVEHLYVPMFGAFFILHF